MKTLGYYLLTIVTLGQFAFVWVYLMAKQTNLGGRELARDIKVFFPLYVIYVGSAIASLIYQKNTGFSLGYDILPVFILILAVAFYLLWLIVKWLFRIAARIREQSIPVPSNLALFFMLCLYAICLPLLQSKLVTLEGRNA